MTGVPIPPADITIFGIGLKTAPIANMLFRSEEIHGTSRIGQVIEPVLKRKNPVNYGAKIESETEGTRNSRMWKNSESRKQQRISAFGLRTERATRRSTIIF
jgi:hypothetical protein